MNRYFATGRGANKTAHTIAGGVRKNGHGLSGKTSHCIAAARRNDGGTNTNMPAPKDILRLVERFTEQQDHYNAVGYKEAQLRQDFINPLFRALGWDMDNAQGHAEAYRDVIHEDAVRIGGGVKAP